MEWKAGIGKAVWLAGYGTRRVPEGTIQDAGERFDSRYLCPVQAWRLGKMLLIALGRETVVDYALRPKVLYGPTMWVCGYSKIQIAYIPSRRVYDESGYQGGGFLYEYGHPADRWAPDVEERIFPAVEVVVRQIQTRAGRSG